MISGIRKKISSCPFCSTFSTLSSFVISVASPLWLLTEICCAAIFFGTESVSGTKYSEIYVTSVSFCVSSDSPSSSFPTFSPPVDVPSGVSGPVFSCSSSSGCTVSPDASCSTCSYPSSISIPIPSTTLSTGNSCSAFSSCCKSSSSFGSSCSGSSSCCKSSSGSSCSGSSSCCKSSSGSSCSSSFSCSTDGSSIL